MVDTTKNETGDTMGDTHHVFEHLGQAPYRYIGYELITFQACPGAPVQVGGSCDHCGTGIKDAFRFRSADGREFKVGSSCVMKAGDAGLYSQITRKVNALKTERKRQRDLDRITAAKEAFQAHRDLFDGQPHPMGFQDRQTGRALTLTDWIEWMLANSGTSGSVKVARRIEKEVKAA